jgi:hypothetical protein
VPSLPEPEALEQHPDPLAPFRDAVQASVEFEVLERGQLPVDERLVRQVPDLAALGSHLEDAARRGEEAGTEAEERRLAGAVRPGDEEEVTFTDVEVEPSDDTLVAETPLEAARADHEAAPSACRSKYSATSRADGGFR